MFSVCLESEFGVFHMHGVSNARALPVSVCMAPWLCVHASVCAHLMTFIHKCENQSSKNVCNSLVFVVVFSRFFSSRSLNLCRCSRHSAYVIIKHFVFSSFCVSMENVEYTQSRKDVDDLDSFHLYTFKFIYIYL